MIKVSAAKRVAQTPELWRYSFEGESGATAVLEIEGELKSESEARKYLIDVLEKIGYNSLKRVKGEQK